MPDLTAAIVADVVAACGNGLAEALESLGRTFDAKFEGAVGEAGKFDAASPEWNGPGLAVLLTCGANSAVIVLREADGLVPAWVAEPDVTGKSKLTTLAQELSMQLLPEMLPADDYRAARVADLAKSLAAAKPADDAALIPIELKTADGRAGKLWLLFPFAAGAELYAAEPPAAAAPAAVPEPARPKPVAAAAPAARPPSAPPSPAKHQPPQRVVGRLEDLPPYAQSLLRIKVPVAVTLARKKQAVSKVVEIGPGTILQFNKSCDQMLELEVNGHEIGAGEAVKVGDKFGLRVVNLKLPGERFHSVAERRAS